jgi:hypothetical protein
VLRLQNVTINRNLFSNGGGMDYELLGSSLLENIWTSQITGGELLTRFENFAEYYFVY